MNCRYSLMLKNSFSVEASVYHASSSAHALTHMSIQTIFMPQDSAGRKSPSGNTVLQLARVTARYSPPHAPKASPAHRNRTTRAQPRVPSAGNSIPTLAEPCEIGFGTPFDCLFGNGNGARRIFRMSPGFFFGLRKIAISSEKARGTALHLLCGDNTRGEYRTRM